MDYTPHQQEAINHLDGNLQIIACAGSGKTQVISQRIINILREKASEGVRPANIVAFTFTDKAAGELKNRIHKLAKEQLGSEFGLAEMYVGTIHGFCLDMLQTYLFKFLKYSVLSEVQQRLLIDRHSNESGLTDLVTSTGQRLQRWKDSRLYQKLLSIVREAQIDEAVLGSHPIRTALTKYHTLLDKKGYLDYSRIMYEAVVALTGNQELREKLASRIKYLIVDEYQDVNPLQECLIRQLHDLGAQLCVVGDDDQTIYQWNGSDIDNILSFADRYPAVHKIPLAENFRSSKGVVETAKNVVERNAVRLPKAMVSREKQPFKHGDMLCLRLADPDTEAAWIAQKIADMRGMPFEENGVARGLAWSDCAVLLRSVRGSAAPILQALRVANIPYIVKGMTGLFDTTEVQAATNIFLYLIGETSRETLADIWLSADLGLVQEKISAGIDVLDQRKASWPDVWQKSVYSLQRTYLAYLDAIELREDAIPDDGGSHRARGEIVYYNLGKFSQLISDYETINFNSEAGSLYQGFAGFLHHQAAEYYPEGWEGAGFAVPDAVQVLTIHQAKGMEFPVVFIPNLLRNRFPSKRQGGRKWSHVIPAAAVVGSTRYDGCEDDERRLFYVALTRSKKYLYCTWAPEASKGMFAKQSLFVNEVTTPTEDMRQQADRALRRYLHENGAILDKVKYAEQAIELKLAEGIVVHGRIDLIRRTDTNEVIIIDFKSTERSQEEDVTRQQLHIYALGYQQLTGSRADLVEIYNLDEGAGATVRELVDDAMLQQTETAIVSAGCDIKENRLCRVGQCSGCDLTGICRSAVAAESAAS